MPRTEAKHAAETTQLPDNKRKDTIRRCVLTAVLIILVIFLIVNRDYLKDRIENDFYPSGAEPNVKISMLGDHVAEQPFVAESGSIGSLGIYFGNDETKPASGTVRVELLDKDGELVAETTLDASLIKGSKPAKFLPGGDSSRLNGNHKIDLHGGYRTYLTKGETYTFRITGTDIQSEGGLDLLLYEDADANTDEALYASFDGETQANTRICMYTKNDVYLKKTIAAFAVLILMTFLFVLLPFRRIDAKLAKRPGRREDAFSTWVSRLMMVISPVVSYFIVQKYVEFGLARFIRHILSDPLKPALNLLVIGFVCWAIYTLSNSTRLASMLTVLLASAFGFTNYMLVQFRNTPLVYTDIAQIGTALQVANSYTITVNKHFLWAILLTVVWCVASFAPPRHRGLPLKKRIIPVAVLALWFGAVYYSIFSASYIEDHELRVSSFKPTESYYRNGCVLSFMITWKYALVKKPTGYDVSTIEALAEKYTSDEALTGTKVSAETPNVIVVMNESFSDLSVLGDFETNEDYLQFYKSLEENAVKGWMYSSVYGGSTANSEFECLTGFSMKYLPLQSVAFRSIIKEETPSLTYYMKQNGYGCNLAIHPGSYNSYNRNVVYPLLGFEDFISKEFMENPTFVRDFVSDEYDYGYVENEYEAFRAQDADSPFYLFNVTIQNHGGYAYSTGVVDAGITVGSGDTDYEQTTQFVNLMKLSDEALEQLIEYYSNVDEETVIVLFGDHQPRIDEEFYAAMKEQHDGISDLEWSVYMHKVPFMIWSNYDMGTASGEEGSSDGNEDGGLLLSANYIAPYLKQMLGMPLTGFDKYLLDLHEELPVINAICYEDADGNIYEPDESSEYDDVLNEYGCVQYNGLIDYKNRVDSFFELKTAE